MNPEYRFARERLFAAVQSLMVPVESDQSAIARAMREVTHALKNITLSAEADRHYHRIMGLMDGAGSWQSRAGSLVRGHRAELSRAVLELFCAVDILYHRDSDRSSGYSNPLNAALAKRPSSSVTEKVVLLVEDNEDTRAIYGTLLKRSGYQVLEAEDGCRAVTILTSVQPHLMLLDIAIPWMDGWTVARWARSVPDTSAVPIVAVTALSHAEHRAQADQLGFAGYLTKPIEPMDLLKCVQGLIGPVALAEDLPNLSQC